MLDSNYATLPSWINAGTVIVLAGITIWYALSAKRQAKAAESQAEAARKQADAAQKTLEFFKTQTEDQSRVAIAALVGSVMQLKDAADYWHNRLQSWGAPVAPVEITLLPKEWAVSLEMARAVPSTVYQELLKLQRSSTKVLYRLRQYAGMQTHNRTQADLDAVKEPLARLSSDCITVFGKLGPLLQPGLINGYLD